MRPLDELFEDTDLGDAAGSEECIERCSPVKARSAAIRTASRISLRSIAATVAIR